MIYKFYNIITYAFLCSGGNAYGFVECNKNIIFRLPRFQVISIHLHTVIYIYLITNIGLTTIDQHLSLFNKTIRFTAGAQTTITYKIIEAHKGEFYCNII